MNAAFPSFEKLILVLKFEMLSIYLNPTYSQPIFICSKILTDNVNLTHISNKKKNSTKNHSTLIVYFFIFCQKIFIVKYSPWNFKWIR